MSTREPLWKNPYLHSKITENIPRTLITKSQNLKMFKYCFKAFNTPRYKRILVMILTMN